METGSGCIPARVCLASALLVFIFAAPLVARSFFLPTEGGKPGLAAAGLLGKRTARLTATARHTHRCTDLCSLGYLIWQYGHHP